MVAQATATRTRKPTKSTYKPHLRVVDADQGLYTVQSERYEYVLYLVDAQSGTCECEAGRRQFQGCKKLGGVCKHLYFVRQYHSHRVARMANADHAATQEVAAVAPVPSVAERLAFIPAPDFFAELYAA